MGIMEKKMEATSQGLAFGIKGVGECRLVEDGKVRAQGRSRSSDKMYLNDSFQFPQFGSLGLMFH